MMIKKCNIKEILTAHENDTVLEVAKTLRDTQKRHLVVVNDNDVPTGFLSVVDINNRVVADERDPKGTLAKDIMTKDLITLDENHDVEEAIGVMTKNNILSCPITRDGKLIGICEIKDVVHQMQKQKLEELDKNELN